jgi:large subunit ribosomal protein L9
VKVILVKDVKGLGNKGDVVQVAEGYARNYLFPRGLVTEASEGKLKELGKRRDAESRRQEKELAAARAIAARLQGVTIKVTSRAGEGGKLFGSVTNKEVAEIIQKKLGLSLDKRRVEIKEPIKALGIYPAVARLHPEVQAAFTIEVVAG